jgi:hypothetical protein
MSLLPVKLRISLAIFVGLMPISSHVSANSLRDYTKFNHTITMVSLRAGNHDPSGQNQYFLRLSQFALANTKDERLKPIEERKKAPAGSRDFGKIDLASLSQWTPAEVNEDGEGTLPFNALKITGDSIRQSTSEMMRTESIGEAEVAHLITIDLYERDKKYLVLNEDKLIASVRYFPIPPSSFDGSERVNQNLQIIDDKGTLVKLSVSYDEPISNPGSSSSQTTDSSSPAQK